MKGKRMDVAVHRKTLQSSGKTTHLDLFFLKLIGKTSQNHYNREESHNKSITTPERTVRVY